MTAIESVELAAAQSLVNYRRAVELRMASHPEFITAAILGGDNYCYWFLETDEWDKLHELKEIAELALDELSITAKLRRVDLEVALGEIAWRIQRLKPDYAI